MLLMGGNAKAKQMPIRLGYRRARGRTAALIVLSTVLLTCALPLRAQSRIASTTLVLQVGQEDLLQLQSGNVALKIRLAAGRTARLWVASSCTSPSPESYLIAKSGTYSIPFNALEPVSSEPPSGAAYVCLLSSDGVLNDSLAVGINAMTGQVVTTQAGTTTVSKP
jgi:hypothetical protein